MYGEDKLPFIMGFWQEPAHTIANDEIVSKEDNLKDYMDFLHFAVDAIKGANSDFQVSAFQNNEANHLNTNKSGTGKTIATECMETFLSKEANIGHVIPIDWYALQVFEGVHLKQLIIAVRKLFMQNPKRFLQVPAMFNRFESGVKGGNDEERLNTNKGCCDLLDSMNIFINTTDFPYALFSSFKKIVKGSWLQLIILDFFWWYV
eukprot:UN27343